MRIAGVVVCVDYAPRLARSIDLWASGLDSLVVVTVPGDDPTFDLCTERGVQCRRSLRLNADGAVFNKAALLDEGVAAVAPRDWLLLFDADVVPPAGWRAAVEAAVPVSWGAGAIFGARRVEEDGSPIADDPAGGGYFQLFHSQDPVWLADPRLGSWRSAAGYDTALAARWHPGLRRVLPLDLVHVGARGRNWCGLGRGAAMASLLRDRLARGGWAHERLDAANEDNGVGGPGGAAGELPPPQGDVGAADVSVAGR